MSAEKILKLFRFMEHFKPKIYDLCFNFYLIQVLECQKNNFLFLLIQLRILFECF